MCMLWNFSALEYSCCLAVPPGLLSLSALNSLLSILKPSARWTSVAVSSQHPLSCLSRLPSTLFRALWQLTSYPCSCSAPTSPSSPISTAVECWGHTFQQLFCSWQPLSEFYFGFSHNFSACRYSQRLQRRRQTSFVLLSLPRSRLSFKAEGEKRVSLGDDGCLWEGNGLVQCGRYLVKHSKACNRQAFQHLHPPFSVGHPHFVSLSACYWRHKGKDPCRKVQEVLAR